MYVLLLCFSLLNFADAFSPPLHRHVRDTIPSHQVDKRAQALYTQYTLLKYAIRRTSMFVVVKYARRLVSKIRFSVRRLPIRPFHSFEAMQRTKRAVFCTEQLV